MSVFHEVCNTMFTCTGKQVRGTDFPVRHTGMPVWDWKPSTLRNLITTLLTKTLPHGLNLCHLMLVSLQLTLYMPKTITIMTTYGHITDQ